MNYANHDHYLICELAKDLAVTEIAEKFELTPYKVRGILKSYGVEPVKAKRVTLAEQIYQLILQGKTNEEIACELDCFDGYIRQVKAKHGIRSKAGSPDAKLLRKQCNKVDALRRKGIALSAACAEIGINETAYQKHRDKSVKFETIRHYSSKKKHKGSQNATMQM